MNNLNRLKNQFVELYSLTRLQRGLRLLLRAFWLGLAGVIAGWGINALFGLLPNPAAWVLIGLAFALAPIILVLVSLYPVLFSLAPNARWVQHLDRQLGLREQLSTAWEITERQPEKDQAGLVSNLLVQDMLIEMPRAKTELLKAGWYQKSDLISSIVMLLLACFVFAAMLFQPGANNQTQNPPEIPPQMVMPESQGEEPSPEQQPGAGDQSQPGEAPGGEMGDQPSEGSQQGNDQAGGGTTGETAGGTSESMDPEAVADALREMGSELSQQAGTYELGKALENLDMEGSAQAMEELNQSLEELTPETRENMAEAMQKAAKAIDQAGEQGMSQNMEEAAESLPEGEEEASQALGDVANDLREMGSSMQQSNSGGGSGAGQGPSTETGSPEPLERLSEEGGDFDLPQEDGTQSDLLSPAPPDTPGEGTASGTLDSTGRAGENVIQNPILPNSLLWKWRDVVSQYFQR